MKYKTLSPSTKRKPWGYDGLIPNEDDLDVLETVLEFLAFKAMSTYKARDYLVYETNRPITAEGLRLIYINRTHPVFDVSRAPNKEGTEDPRGQGSDPLGDISLSIPD
jgi:hypothetical protein